MVLGDVLLDEWCHGHTDRLCREAPVPVLDVQEETYAPGGAGNTAVNLARLGARAVLVAAVGADPAGQRVRAELAAAGVVDRTVTVPGRPTPVKRRLLADGQLLLRQDLQATPTRLPTGAGERLRRRLVALTLDDPAPVLLVCDYGLGGIPDDLRRWLLVERARFDPVGLDAHDLRRWEGLAPTIVVPSFEEAQQAIARAQADGLDEVEMEPGDETAPRVRAAYRYAAGLLNLTGAQTVAVTVDRDGVVIAGQDGQRYRTRAWSAPTSYTAGAGDTYLATAALAIAAGGTLPEIAELAQRAAQLALVGPGTCVCDRERLRAELPVPPAPATPSHGPAVVDLPELMATVQRCRDAGGRVVFTNGCFDILHRGHVTYLEQARQLGDLLVVAVNSDTSVRRLKGPHRPVNPVEDRVAVLAALSAVDQVAVFEEDSPASLIEAIRPEVYVKGGDYPPELVPEAPLVRRLGGQVQILGYVPDRSTSAAIARIRGRADRARAPAAASARADAPTGEHSHR